MSWINLGKFLIKLSAKYHSLFDKNLDLLLRAYNSYTELNGVI